MQTVALKPKRAEWTAIRIGLAVLCGIMLTVPALCAPIALCLPLLACPLVGRKEEPLAWLSAAVPAVSSLIAGYDVGYACSLLLPGLYPLVVTRFIPIPKRPGAKGMLLYMTATAFSLLVVLAMAQHMLGGTLHAVLPGMIVERVGQMENLSEFLRRLAVQGLVSVPDGYTAIVEKEIAESSDENVAGMRFFMRAAKKKNYELILLDVKACQCTYLNGDLTEELIREIASQEPKATEK